MVKSRLTYGCETWVLTKKQESTIDSAHVRLLRKMVTAGEQRKSTRKQITDFQDLAKKATSVKEETELLSRIDWSMKYRNDQIRQITHAEPST